jgi:enoyl-CoA hydratase
MNVDVSLKDHIAVVTYSNPPVNAIARPGFFRLTEVFRHLGEDRDVHVVVFTGEGTRAFIAGADLKIRDITATQVSEVVPASHVLDSGTIAREAFEAVLDCGVPVVAAVNGHAYGAGMAYVAMCDFVVASDHARFGMTEINVGLLGGGSHLIRVLGVPRARRMFLTGRKASAEEMHQWGVVDEVVPAEQVLASAMEIASEIAAKSPIAVRLAKESLNRIENLPYRDAYRVEQDYTRRLLRYEDSYEARRAFTEKRAPVWSWTMADGSDSSKS